MTSVEHLISRLKGRLSSPIPLPAAGNTTLRHTILLEAGREDLSLARLAEAHWDAVAILAEAGRTPKPNVIYGVWAAELPGTEVSSVKNAAGLEINGVKHFCSGADLIDRALVTVTVPEHRLIDVDLRNRDGAIQFDDSQWKTTAFEDTKTAVASFRNVNVSADDVVGDPGWYLSRPGFWHGACGPAACWAGGAIGLFDWAIAQSRHDPHTLAHLGAMASSVWALKAYLDQAGREIDANPTDAGEAQVRALKVRHLVEQACSDILQRLPRAYGPYPLAMSAEVIRRHQELNLYIRQSHAERDLESLGHLLIK